MSDHKFTFYVLNAGSFEQMTIRGRGNAPFVFERKQIRTPDGQEQWAHIYEVDGVDEFHRVEPILRGGQVHRKVCVIVSPDGSSPVVSIAATAVEEVVGDDQERDDEAPPAKDRYPSPLEVAKRRPGRPRKRDE